MRTALIVLAAAAVAFAAGVLVGGYVDLHPAPMDNPAAETSATLDDTIAPTNAPEVRPTDTPNPTATPVLVATAENVIRHLVAESLGGKYKLEQSYLDNAQTGLVLVAETQTDYVTWANTVPDRFARFLVGAVKEYPTVDAVRLVVFGPEPHSYQARTSDIRRYAERNLSFADFRARWVEQ